MVQYSVESVLWSSWVWCGAVWGACGGVLNVVWSDVGRTCGGVMMGCYGVVWYMLSYTFFMCVGMFFVELCVHGLVFCVV